MIKFNYTFWFSLFIFLNSFQNGQSILKCYLCTDCADPFSETYPYISTVTNQNYGASCMKTVLTLPTSQLVSRGTTFNCVQASASNIKVYCCQTDFCNDSNSLKQFASLLFFPIFYTFYLLLN